jgi:hypothetical protein
MRKKRDPRQFQSVIETGIRFIWASKNSATQPTANKKMTDAGTFNHSFVPGPQFSPFQCWYTVNKLDTFFFQRLSMQRFPAFAEEAFELKVLGSSVIPPACLYQVFWPAGGLKYSPFSGVQGFVWKEKERPKTIL